MGKWSHVRSMVKQWRATTGRDGRRPGYRTGLLLLALALLVKWPKKPPRIEPFIYAHF